MGRGEVIGRLVMHSEAAKVRARGEVIGQGKPLWEHTERINKTRKVFKTHIDWLRRKIVYLSALCETT